MPNGVSNHGIESTVGIGKACRICDRRCYLRIRRHTRSELLNGTRRDVRTGKSYTREGAQDSFAESAATGTHFQNVALGLVNEQTGNDAGSAFEAATSGCGSMTPPALARTRRERVEVMSFGECGGCGHGGDTHSRGLSVG